MSRKTAASAIDLNLRKSRIVSSAEIGIYLRPFSNISSNFGDFGRKDEPFSPKWKRIDFSRVKALDDAVHLFDEMVRRDPQPSVVVYNNLLSITAKMEQYPFALHMFDDMRGMGVSMNDKVADALKLFEKILFLELCEPDEVMILTVIDGLCKAGRIITAHDLIREIERTSGRMNVSALLDGFCKGGMVDDALELLSKMAVKGVLPNVVSYSSVIEGLCNVGRMKEVEALLNEMADSKIPMNVVTFSILIHACCKEGKMSEAQNMLQYMKQQNVCPNVVTYNALIEGYCLQGEMDKAKQVFDSLADTDLKPNIVCYGNIASRKE